MARSERRRGCLGRLVLGLVLVLVAGAIAVWRLDLVDRWQDSRLPWSAAPAQEARSQPAATSPSPGLQLPDAEPVPPVAQPVDDTARISPRRVAQALGGDLDDRDLGRSVGVLVTDLQGREVYAAGRQRLTPASTVKLLTAAAALERLGPAHTFTTKVVAGRRAGEVVLVGGGDPYLASRPEQDDYPPRADVRTLARRTAAELRAQGVRRVRVSWDDGLFSGPPASSGWQSDYLVDDIVAPIGALWVDEGRSADGWSRVDDPPAHAADVFARALARAGLTVRGRPRPAAAPEGATPLAEVQSAPLELIVERMLQVSDNEAAEVLGHHLGLAAGGRGDFASGAAATIATLDELGVPTAGLVLDDASGLSRRDQMPLVTLTTLLATAAEPDRPTLRAVLTGLPVAGFDGSLEFRFQAADPEALGRVRAKTGTLTEAGVHGLAGLVTDRDGHPMLFAILADRVRIPRTLGARDALDDLAADLAACHCGR